MALDLTTAAGRVRFALGDLDAATFIPTGISIADLLTQFDDDEAVTAVTAARALKAYYGRSVLALSASGKSLAWANRFAAWDDLILGRAPYPFGPDGSGASSAFSAGAARDDGYSALEDAS